MSFRKIYTRATLSLAALVMAGAGYLLLSPSKPSQYDTGTPAAVQVSLPMTGTVVSALTPAAPLEQKVLQLYNVTEAGDGLRCRAGHSTGAEILGNAYLAKQSPVDVIPGTEYVDGTSTWIQAKTRPDTQYDHTDNHGVLDPGTTIWLLQNNGGEVYLSPASAEPSRPAAGTDESSGPVKNTGLGPAQLTSDMIGLAVDVSEDAIDPKADKKGVITAETMDCMKQKGIDRIIVNIRYPEFFRQTAETALKAGMEVEAYARLDWYEVDKDQLAGELQAKYGNTESAKQKAEAAMAGVTLYHDFSSILSSAISSAKWLESVTGKPSRLWLDVEESRETSFKDLLNPKRLPTNRMFTQDYIAAHIEQAVKTCQEQGLVCGVYSSKYMETLLLGSNQIAGKFPGLGYWYADWDTKTKKTPGFEGWRDYNSWTFGNVVMRQYGGWTPQPQQCGLTQVDPDYFIKGR